MQDHLTGRHYGQTRYLPGGWTRAKRTRMDRAQDRKLDEPKLVAGLHSSACDGLLAPEWFPSGRACALQEF
jgi:hypothetical protein